MSRISTLKEAILIARDSNLFNALPRAQKIERICFIADRIEEMNLH